MVRCISFLPPWQLVFVAVLGLRWGLTWKQAYSWWLLLDGFIALCFVSYFFRRFPLFWTNGPALAKLRHVQSIAHRGGRETTAENTLLAFKNGAAHSQCIELDVWLTQDEEVVVFHDEDLSRMCGVQRRVVDCRRQSLPFLKFPTSDEWAQGFNPHPSQLPEGSDAGAVVPPTADDQPENYCSHPHRIPLLAEVFALLETLEVKPMVIVEFKQRSPVLVRKVEELIAHYKLEQWIIWFSLNADINKDLERANPNRLRIMSVTEIARVYLFYYLGILPFIPLSAHIFGFPGISIPTGFLLRIPIFKKWSTRSLEKVRDLLQYIVVNGPLVCHLARRGVPTIVLGVNTLESLQLVNSMGLQWSLPNCAAPRSTRCSNKQILCDSVSLLTDRPEWLKDILKAQS